MFDGKEEVFTLTPKGALGLAISRGGGLDEVWNDLRNFVELQARRNGYTDGFPALVFGNDGGDCALVAKATESTKAKRRAKA